MKDDGTLRTSSTGANRNSAIDKINYEGINSPIVDKVYGEYLHKHRILPNGDIRSNDNWQKLFGNYAEHKQICMESACRHQLDWRLEHRKQLQTNEKVKELYTSRDGMIEAICGLIFNAKAYLYAYLLGEEENRIKEEVK